jgi:hypothetical protein
MKLAFVVTATIGILAGAAAQAGQYPPPGRSFVDTLQNNAPLQFGLTPDEAATALGAPLVYVKGRPGHEVFAATVSGGNFFWRTDTLFLQFRKGRLTGWKADRRIVGGLPGGPW